MTTHQSFWILSTKSSNVVDSTVVYCPHQFIMKISPSPDLSTKQRLFLLVFSLLSMVTGASAQTVAEFQITKIEPAIVTTPMISYSGATQKPGRPKSWMEIETTFTWHPRLATQKFSDDVVFNYYVLLANRSAAFPQGTMLTGQVTHTSIPANQSELKTVMYVSPRSMERFFDGKIPSSVSSAIVDIGITASIQGQVVAQQSLKGTGTWWPQYQQTTGFLLNKSETPFASLNSDYYEPVKKQQP